MSQIGYNPNTPQATPTQQGKSFNLGDRYEDDDGNVFVYVQADGAVTGTGYVCIVSAAYQAAMVSTSNDLQGGLLAVAPVAFADDDYGWMQIYGACSLRVAASCAANVPLNITAMAGQLDDDATSGALVAAGVFLTTARAASAGTAPATLNWAITGPDVGAVTYTTINATTGNIGTVNTGAINGTDASLGITGLAAAAGGDVVLTGGASAGGNNNGGSVVLEGGALNGTGVKGSIAERGTVLKSQAAPAAKTVTAGLTAAEIVAGLITTTGVTAPSIHQLPTGTEIDAAIADVATGDSFDFTIINTGTGASDDATITVNTDVTIIGNPTVGALTDATIISGSGRFRARRSAANEYVVYRIA